MRFASLMFDRYRAKLSAIENFDELSSYLESLDLGRRFVDFAAAEGIVAKKGEWELSEAYMMPQLKALVGRYSKLDDEAFYRFYIDIDETIKVALENPGTVAVR